jgi:hypothetical protein
MDEEVMIVVLSVHVVLADSGIVTEEYEVVTDSGGGT